VDQPTLDTLAGLLAAGRTSSRALVEACLARIEDRAGEGQRTFLFVDREGALAAADAMDMLRAANAAPSQFAGIPISVKDLFDVKGQVTRAGSRVLASRPAAERDAESVARLRRAGLVVIGRTNMTEFAFSGLGVNPHYDTPRNPWERAAERIPGGSSSGAAISVTDGMAYAGLGTDTGGSCRIPAAFTGLVGYKPTADSVPLTGAIPLSTSLDSIGSIARTVACCAAMHAILSDTSIPALGEQRVSGLRLGVPKTFVLDGMDRVVDRAFEAAISRLSTQGAKIEEFDLPELTDIPAINHKGGFGAAESFAWHRKLMEKHAALYDPRVLTRIHRGAEQNAADYIDLLAERAALIAAVEKKIARFDALALPTVPIIPPKLSELVDDAEYSRINLLALRNPTVINMVDGCAISLPVHEAGAAPVGLMLAMPRGSDARLLQIAAAVERALS
jgi:aspartyl-tRNA(Asn)/glutamyl-tRNA(Gln) amidotransferase subunit A